MPEVPQSNPIVRLRRLISEWRGVERGEDIAALFDESRTAAGALAPRLLPVAIDNVGGLSEASLNERLHTRWARRRNGAEARFRVPRTGRFDSALVPVGRAGEAPDRWLLVVEDALSPRDRHALYAHIVGHLLLDFELGERRLLDPGDGFTHADVLAELRAVENSRRSEADNRVLDAFPEFADLLVRTPETPPASAVEVAELRTRLKASGWPSTLVDAPYVYAAGRVFAGDEPRRGRRSQADALLRADTSLPIAVVRLARDGEPGDVAEQQAHLLARRLYLPFAYALGRDRSVREIDRSDEANVEARVLDAIPSREALLERWLARLGLTDVAARDAICYPYETSRERLRYYQEAAVNRTVAAVLQARRGLRKPRVMLNLATGTGKTKIAFQIIWKLKRSRAVARTLYLTDREHLVSVPMDNEFAPFGEARGRIQGEIDTAREILFATYQALGDTEDRRGIFRDYQRNFFDLVVVDECHRGGANENSLWHDVLEYFDSAVQIGMTATPRDTDTVQNYEYFGDPLVVYSLRDGITDGFLAPYRVRRVLLGEEGEGSEAAAEPDPREATRTEPAERLRLATDAIACHVAEYLDTSDPMAKTIVFCVDQAHADRMRAAIASYSAGLVSRYPAYVTRIVADEGQDGRNALARFTRVDDQTPVVVTTSKLLSTGVDVPTCKNIVLARPVNSVVEFKQIIGRGTRLHWPAKTWFTILDYAGATKHFFDPDFDGDPESVIIESLARALEEAAGDAATPSEAVDVSAAPAVATSTPEPSVNNPLDPPAPSEASAPPMAVPTPIAPETDLEEPAAVVPPAEVHAEQNDQAADLAPPVPTTPHADAVAAVVRPPHVAPLVLAPAPFVRPSDGVRLRVVGEIVFELGPDGATLRKAAYDEYTRETVSRLVSSEGELREAWLISERRDAVLTGLREEGVDLRLLAGALGLEGVDDYDAIRQAAFGIAARTRADRATRVRVSDAVFLEDFAQPAREVLDAILDKYEAGDAPDPGDPALLSVPPLSSLGAPLELVARFGGGESFRAALDELRALIYTDGPTIQTAGMNEP